MSEPREDPETQVRDGMRVFDRSGRLVGSVVGLGETHFQVERGAFRQKDYLVEFGAVAMVRDREVHLAARIDQLEVLVEDVNPGEASREPLTH